MQELFYHCFEQFHDNTFLLILCGPKGNGKSLRTERLQAVFPEGWVKQSGPSSNKAGMQGNNDSNNGCNLVYDEMIDELVDSQGGNRIEYWKTILLKVRHSRPIPTHPAHRDASAQREYVYNKVVSTKGSDGVETNRTFKLMNHHLETHVACTNFGPTFTKGEEVPSEVKTALIDRSIALFVRTLGSKPRLDAEFKAHQTNPEVKRKTSAFRTLVSLMGITLMAIRKVPFWAPDMALAQKMWDEWDAGPYGINQGHGLPKPSPRKNVKRLQNCITMCVLNAVAEVFFLKQTACQFACSQLDADGRPKPFDVTMLYEVIKRLQPSPEIIHHAWSMSLEYSIGTSMLGFAGMTVMTDILNKDVSQLLQKLPDESHDWIMSDGAIKMMMGSVSDLDMQRAAAEGGADDGPPPPGALRGAGGGGGSHGRRQTSMREFEARGFTPPGKQIGLLPAFKQLLEGGEGLSDEAIFEGHQRIYTHRLARSQYLHHAARNATTDVITSDADKVAIAAVNEECALMNSMSLDEMTLRPPIPPAVRVIKANVPLAEVPAAAAGPNPASSAPRPPIIVERTPDMSVAEYTARLRASQEPPPPPTPTLAVADDPPSPSLQALATDFSPPMPPGLAPRSTAAAMTAPRVPHASRHPHLPYGWSAVAPSIDTIVLVMPAGGLNQMSAGGAYPVEDEEEARLGKNPSDTFHTFETKNGNRGIDYAWMLAFEGSKVETWRRAAIHTLTQSASRTAKQFDVHLDGLRDLYYMISSADNRRIIQLMPIAEEGRRTSDAFQCVENDKITPTTRAVRVRPFEHPEMPGEVAPPGYMAPPRHPSLKLPSSTRHRQWDAQVRAGRYPLAQLLMSTRTQNAPPMRMVDGVVQCATSMVYDHLQFVADALHIASLLPGLKNRQETFCHDQKGPPGLSLLAEGAEDGETSVRRPPTFGDDGDEASDLSGDESDCSGSKRGAPSTKGAPRRDKRTNRDVEDMDIDPEEHHTLAYSYDLTQIYLSWKMADMMYDDMSDAHIKSANERYGEALGVTFEASDIPQLTLRYPGYSEVNRQTLSIPLRRERSRQYKFNEAGDPSAHQARVTLDHVSRSIGRQATNNDLLQYVSRQQGSRSMKGVTGDLFATSTWLRHTLSTLSDRGLIGGRDDLAQAGLSFANMHTCLTSRAIELASHKGVDGYAHFAMMPSQPRTYAAMEQRNLLDAIEERRSTRDDAMQMIETDARKRRGRRSRRRCPSPYDTSCINDCIVDAANIVFPTLPNMRPPTPPSPKQTLAPKTPRTPKTALGAAVPSAPGSSAAHGAAGQRFGGDPAELESISESDLFG